MATTHIDFRKIDYDQLIDKPIIRTDASVDTLTTAGVYDKGDGKRYIVSVDGQNITQVIEEKDGYQERISTDGGSTWGDWDTVEFAAADDIDAEDVNYDNTTSELQATNVQDAIDEIDTSIDDIKEDITEIKNIIEVTEMEGPSEENEGNIIQYKGETNANFTQGYFYKCVSDGQDPATYSWVRIDVQPAGAGDDHEFITLTAYNQLTPTQKAEKVYMITEDGVPGSGLTAGAGIDITNNIISADMTTAVYDNTTSGATATNVQDAIDEVFQSVSNGKTLIAAAITDKGVSTAASDSFQTMATNIGLIQTGCPSSVVSILSDDGEGATKYFVIQDNSAVNVGSYVDKKNVKGKDVYMISAVNGQNNGGNMKIVIVDQNGNVTLKKFTGINVYKHIYCSTIKYLPLSNAIAIMGEFSSTSTHGGAVSIAIDFDTYENASLVYNDPYDDSYLDTVQGNGGIDFLQYNAKVGDNKVGYALMSPIML